jgi:RNA-binding protein YlmH
MMPPVDLLDGELEALALRTRGDKATQFLRWMLDSWGVAVARETAKDSGIESLMWGGAPGAKRVVAAFHPPGQIPDTTQFPIVCISVDFSNPYIQNPQLRIRRALEECGIDSARVGDIFEFDGRWHVFIVLPDDVVTFPLSDDTGKTSDLSFARHPRPFPSPPMTEPKLVNTTVSSMRIDSLLAASFKPSRSRMSRMADASLVFVNDRRIHRKNISLKEGDSAVVKGYGLMRVLAVSGETRKGRIRVSLEINPDRED